MTQQFCFKLFTQEKNMSIKQLYKTALAALFVMAQNWKQPNVYQLVNEWKILAHTHHHGLLLSNKEWTTPMCNNMDRSFQKQFVKWMQADTKDYILFDSIYVTF